MRERVWGLQEVKAEGGLAEKKGSGWVVECLGLEEEHCFSNQKEQRGV